MARITAEASTNSLESNRALRPSVQALPERELTCFSRVVTLAAETALRYSVYIQAPRQLSTPIRRTLFLL